MNDKVKKEIIGNLIKTEREKQDLTQYELSSLIGIDPRNLSNIELGKSFPSLSTFCKIVEVLKVEPNYFLNFIQFNKVKEDDLNVELYENIKTLSVEVKIKINELLKILKK